MSASPPSRPPSDRIREAMRLLAEEARERVERHPLGHLLAGHGEALDLRLPVPTALRDGALDKLAGRAAEAMQEALSGLLEHRAVFQPGRVLCLRCASASCEHSHPADSREVFAGYGPTGLPRFADFGQWLLARRDPRVDLLYREPPQVVTLIAGGAELNRRLLDAFADLGAGYRLHGEVAAGWYRSPDPSGRARPIAVSFQVVSTRPRRGQRRFGLNVIGMGPAGEPLEHLWDRIGEIPWADAVRWAQGALDGIRHARSSRRGAAEAERVERRIDGLLQGLARRLEKGERAKERRTRHAQDRHAGGDRPTRMALADLARANGGDVLYDTRRQTLVVVGERGRAHVFNPEGKLVTSIRYTPAAIERRKERELWRPATREEIAALKGRVVARGADDVSDIIR